MLQLIVLVLGLLLLFGYTHITTTGTTRLAYRTPFNGQAPHVNHLTIDPVDFDGVDWCDENGYLIPGTPLQADATPATGNGEDAAFIVPYPVKIATGNTTAILTAAADQQIGVATRGDLLQATIEANIGRVLTADELANIAATGRFVIL